MADRRIAIKITVENTQAVQATQQQTKAVKDLNDVTDKHTHLQNGLTNSFIKGNLAARAISVAYISVRDAFQAGLKGAIDFEFTMAKIAAISGESKTAISALEKDVRSLALSSNKSAVELGKAALEMNKMGLSAPQVRMLIGNVNTLATALDEDLVTSAETVVQVLNAYGDSVLMGKTRTEQLATTVAISALDMDKFRTAFSYVGATAKMAGVTFEELTASMDMLSNAGIKSSTIGTQLRRIFIAISTEGSAASKAIGGTVGSLGGLIPAMEALHRVTPKGEAGAGFLEGLFGLQAASVASLMQANTEKLKEFKQQTLDSTDTLRGFNALMQETTTFKLGVLVNSWKDLGIEIWAVVDGPVKGFIDAMAEAGKLLSNAVKTAGSGNFQVGYAGGVAPAGVGAPAALGLGDLLAMDQKALQEAVKESDKLLRKQAADTAELKAEVTSALLESVKLDFEVYKTFGGKFDFTGITKQLTDLANSLLKVGDAEQAVKVMKELRAIQAQMKKDEKTKPGETGFALPNKSLYSMTDRNIGNNVSQDSFGNKLASSPSMAYLFSDDSSSQLSGFADKLIEISNAFEGLNSNVDTFGQKMAAFVGAQAAIDGVNGSVGILSTYFVEGIFSSKEDPFKGISDAFGNFAKQMAADLTALIAKILIFKALLSVLPVVGGAAGFVKGIAGAVVPGFPFASGTDQIVRQPTAFIAGEAGAERVTVTPRAKMSAGGEGQTVVFNIQGDVYDYDRFARKVKEAQGSNRSNFV